MQIFQHLVAYMVFSYLHDIVLAEKSFLTAISECTLSEDGKLNFTQLASKYGYPAEQHDVITEDGYILTIFRIPGTKPPVLLFHGIIDSADTFIIRGNTSMVITLARAGYDVWVGNGRGNKYARSHVSLNPDTDKEFWDYSLHEMGYYDLAATIDFVREKTGEDSISTIGHSQGTTCYYVLTSSRPEYNDRIKISIQLAPVAFLSHLIPPVSLVALAGPAINALLETLGVEELLENQKATSNLIKFICSKGIVSYGVCTLGALLPLTGFDPSGIEPAFAQVLFGHYPAATSRKSLLHFDQIALRKKFSQFDYAFFGNLDEYDSASPPDYDLRNVTTKIALIFSGNDELSRVKDVELLRDNLQNVVHYEMMKPKKWNHVDFVWGSSMTEYLYPSIFKILEDYN